MEARGWTWQLHVLNGGWGDLGRMKVGLHGGDAGRLDGSQFLDPPANIAGPALCSLLNPSSRSDIPHSTPRFLCPRATHASIRLRLWSCLLIRRLPPSSCLFYCIFWIPVKLHMWAVRSFNYRHHVQASLGYPTPEFYKDSRTKNWKVFNDSCVSTAPPSKPSTMASRRRPSPLNCSSLAS